VPFVTLSAPNAGAAANTLPFAATLAVGSASNYAWAFGDGGSANTPGSSTTHAYSMPGTYTVTVTATISGTGALSSNSALLSISEAPLSGLSAASSSPTVLGRTTYFNATLSSGTNVTYTWSYGEGSVGSGANAQHVYAASGTYTAIVTATNSISTASATTGVSVLWPNYLPLIQR
jgi:PKD repeat protein